MKQEPTEHPERPTTRYDAQIAHIMRAFEADGIQIGVATGDDAPEDAEFLYERGVILVRDEDIERVRTELGEIEVRDALINGLTVISLAGTHYDTVGALARLDNRLGIGVATPNHVASIAPVSHCPATEPEEVVAGAAPDPGICPAPDDGAGVRLYVGDTGLLDGAAATHSWLADVQGTRDPFPQPPQPGQAPMRPYTGHGTFISGVARCMAPAVQVFSDNIFRRAGAALESEVVLRLLGALRRDPDIISLSAGVHTRRRLPSLGFEVLLGRLRHHKGVVLVAAAGNDQSTRPFWPAASPRVVSVGALSANWRSRAWFSNYGGWVDVYAPGEGLVNAFATGTYVCTEPPHVGERRRFEGMARWSGTSFSTPLVAGLIAARMSRTGENGRTAARALLANARKRAVHGLGAVLLPCLDEGGHRGGGGRGHGGCGCGHDHHRCGHH
ncbi:MAG TPA: S8/S53 family peptidase [Actinomycetes bacterium]